MRPVIDVHCHYSSWGGVRIPEDSPQRTLEMFAQHGVDGVVIAPLVNLFSNYGDCRKENDQIRDYCSAAPDRLFPACTVNPLEGQPALEELKRCHDDLGCRILKLHPWLQGFSVSSPEMDPVAELCQELGVAILFHDGTPVYSHALQMARLCRDYPRLKVIAGHAGLGDLWHEAMLAALRYPSFYLCLCGPRERAMRIIIDQVPARQICVGADFSTSDKDDAVLWFRWRSFRELSLPEHTRSTIERDTPADLLGLS